VACPRCSARVHVHWLRQFSSSLSLAEQRGQATLPNLKICPVEWSIQRRLIVRSFEGQRLIVRGFEGQRLIVRSFEGQRLIVRGFGGHRLIVRSFGGRRLIVRSFGGRRLIVCCFGGPAANGSQLSEVRSLSLTNFRLHQAAVFNLPLLPDPYSLCWLGCHLVGRKSMPLLNIFRQKAGPSVVPPSRMIDAPPGRPLHPNPQGGSLR